MEYEKDLYNMDKVVCGLTVPFEGDPNRRELTAIYVQDGDSFGLLVAGKGRRIAMNNSNYEPPVKNGRFSGFERINNITIRSFHGDGIPRFDAGNIEILNDENKFAFQELFDQNTQLRPADRFEFGKALLNYSKNKKPPKEETAKAKKARAAYRFLQKIRTNTRQDRRLAKLEYDALPHQFKPIVRADDSTDNEIGELPVAPSNLVFDAATISPYLDTPNEEPIDQAESILIYNAFTVPNVPDNWAQPDSNELATVPESTDLSIIEAAIVDQIVNRRSSISHSSDQSPSPRRGQRGR